MGETRSGSGNGARPRVWPGMDIGLRAMSGVLAK
jgi:hypothetical protein